MEKFLLYNGEVELTYDDFKHRYFAKEVTIGGDNELVPGVTSLLGVVAKPMLIGYAAKEAVKELGWYERETWTPDGYIPVPEEEQAEGYRRMVAKHELFKTLSPDEWWRVLKEAKGAHVRKKEAAADAGTMVHDWIERWIKGETPATPTLPKVKEGVEAFIRWVDNNEVSFALSEKPIYSRRFKFAGRMDFTAMVNGEYCVGDVKTSNFFDPRFFWQTSAYQLARTEEFPEEEYDGQVIVRCGKDGTLEVKHSKNYTKDARAFLSSRRIYLRQLEQEKEFPRQ